jgi:hypothetical protein
MIHISSNSIGSRICILVVLSSVLPLLLIMAPAPAVGGADIGTDVGADDGSLSVSKICSGCKF